ncbi:MAG: ribonuclease P protein component [Atribacterota bacterium]|nr:ribonuclease P protein component [Atribacterota bacterium]
MESLTRKGDFVRVFQQGKRKRAGLLKFFFLERKDGALRVAFVGKSKKAVYRNRVRRRLREAFRVCFYPQWQERPVDFIFWGDERLCSVRFVDIQSWMGQLLEEVPVKNKDQGNRED